MLSAGATEKARQGKPVKAVPGLEPAINSVPPVAAVVKWTPWSSILLQRRKNITQRNKPSDSSFVVEERLISVRSPERAGLGTRAFQPGARGRPNNRMHATAHTALLMQLAEDVA